MDTSEQVVKHLERELRDATLIIAALVRDLGGEVTVPHRALVEAQGIETERGADGLTIRTL